MSKIYDGGPAFPIPEAVDGVAPGFGGISLRDYFAAKASDQDVSFQGEILREQIARSKGIGILPDDWRVTARYMHADAMLAAREAVKVMPEHWTPDGVADPEGWTEWNGGECPVPKGSKFWIKFRDGDACDAGTGDGLTWNHDGTSGDIIAYRIVSNGDQK